MSTSTDFTIRNGIDGYLKLDDGEAIALTNEEVIADLGIVGGGSVTDVSVATANGVSGTVLNPTTTPAITLALGAITPASVAAVGAMSGSNLSGTNTGDETQATIKTKLGAASSGVDGYLSGTDWNTFNNKQSAITTGNLTSSDITVTGGTNAVIGSGASLAIASNAVTTAKIADSNVTLAKIANVADQTILGNNTGGNAAPLALTASQGRTVLGLGTIATQAANSVSISGGTITGITDLVVADGGTGVSTLTNHGVVIGQGASAVAVTSAGTSGQVLTSNGASADPTFQANTGGWTTLAVSGTPVTTTGQVLVDVTGLSFTPVASTRYEIELTLLVGSSNASGVQFGFATTGGGSTVRALFTGQTSGTAAASIGVSAGNTAEGTAFSTNSSTAVVKCWAIIDSGTGASTISFKFLKTTSGTATINLGSVMRYRILGT